MAKPDRTFNFPDRVRQYYNITGIQDSSGYQPIGPQNRINIGLTVPDLEMVGSLNVKKVELKIDLGGVLDIIYRDGVPNLQSIYYPINNFNSSYWCDFLQDELFFEAAFYRTPGVKIEFIPSGAFTGIKMDTGTNMRVYTKWPLPIWNYTYTETDFTYTVQARFTVDLFL